MFSKKTCQRCGRKTSKNNSFCPNCGFPLGKERIREEFGMLGENDSFSETDPFANPFLNGMGGLSSSFMNKMFSHTMKMLEKEMGREIKGTGKNQKKDSFPKTKIRLMINGKEINLNNLEENQNSDKKAKQKQIKPMKFKRFSDEQAKKFSALPKKEPKTDLKRIADKINYEIEIPGVESVEDVSITPLENSIEIKAVSKEKAYSKSIPINLPVTAYEFSKGLLVLEFKGN